MSKTKENKGGLWYEPLGAVGRDEQSTGCKTRGTAGTGTCSTAFGCRSSRLGTSDPLQAHPTSPLVHIWRTATATHTAKSWSCKRFPFLIFPFVNDWKFGGGEAKRHVSFPRK